MWKLINELDNGASKTPPHKVYPIFECRFRELVNKVDKAYEPEATIKTFFKNFHKLVHDKVKACMRQ